MFSNDEFAYGLHAPEPSAEDEQINELLYRRIDILSQLARLNDEVSEIDCELAALGASA